MFVLVLCVVFSQSLAENIVWKNCGSGYDWVHISHFDISPRPVILPGDMSVTLKGRISHELGHQVTMDVIVEKNLLDTWVTVPCHNNVGTCHYTDPCHFLHSFETSGRCPVQLAKNGIDCTCPFNPKTLNLAGEVFHVSSVSNGFEGFLSDNHPYRVTLRLNDKYHGQVERMCLQAIIHISVSTH